jgi:hypothetical protein
MPGRGTIYMGAVSSALTFAALLRNTMENLVLLEKMQRIRRYYAGLVPEAEQFFDPAEAEAQLPAAMATVGLRVSPLQCRVRAAPAVSAAADRPAAAATLGWQRRRATLSTWEVLSGPGVCMSGAVVPRTTRHGER